MAWTSTVTATRQNPVPDGSTWYDVSFTDGTHTFAQTFHVVPANIPNPAAYLAAYIAGLNNLDALNTTVQGLIGNVFPIGGSSVWSYKIISMASPAKFDGTKIVTLTIFDTNSVHSFTNSFLLTPYNIINTTYLGAWLANYVAQITNVDFEAFYLATVNGNMVAVS